MKYLYLLFFFSLFFSVCSYCQEAGYKVGIIPTPQQMRITGGDFVLNGKTILYSDGGGRMAVSLFRSSISGDGRLVDMPEGRLRDSYGKDTTVIAIMTESDAHPGGEGYRLKISPKRITLTGNSAGVFYGVQTLLQAFSPGGAGVWVVPCMDIEDSPRFAYRGLMLDVSRHFFTVAQVEDVLDLMARYKLNTFHWHLTDDQGWRLEIKKYPKLTSVGAWHANTVEDGDRDEPDSVVTGGYYTQEQVREVVRYAAERFITIIPEIEVPAHSAAVLRAYPGLKCVLPVDSPDLAANNFIYCPSEETFRFLEDVLTEVMSLFPGKYIHVGGDEANKKPWEESPFCRDLMKKLGLHDVHALQAYFIQRIEKFLVARGRRLIGWDEIAEGGLAQSATVMCRFGAAGESKVVKSGHPVIMTPGIDGLYFDYPQSNSGLEPFCHGTHVSPLEKTYSYDPAPAWLTAEEKKLVLGVQGSLWTEHVATMNKLYYMTIPRIFGLAEVGWTLPEHKNRDAFFKVSVPKNLGWLEDRGYNFRVPTAFAETDTVMTGHRFVLENGCLLPGAKVYYTLNGRTPTENDREFNGPLVILVPKNERRELRTVVVSRTGKRSVPTRTVMYNYDLFPALNPLPAADGPVLHRGLRYYTYAPDPWDTSLSPIVISRGVLTDLRLDTPGKALKKFSIVCQGYVDIPADGMYSFFLPARDNDKLFIDGRCVIADASGFSRIEKIGVAPLRKGFHTLRLNYASEGGGAISFFYQAAGGERRKLTADVVFY